MYNQRYMYITRLRGHAHSNKCPNQTAPSVRLEVCQCLQGVCWAASHHRQHSASIVVARIANQIIKSDRIPLSHSVVRHSICSISIILSSQCGAIALLTLSDIIRDVRPISIITWLKTTATGISLWIYYNHFLWKIPYLNNLILTYQDSSSSNSSSSAMSIFSYSYRTPISSSNV